MNQFFCDKMNDIQITDWVKKELGANRFKMFDHNERYLNDSGLTVDVEHISNFPQGRFKLNFKGKTFDVFFNYKPQKPLYVFLNGWLVDSYPEFKRWYWYTFIEGSVLNIADPMLLDHNDLRLGWYYGSKSFDYRRHIAEMVTLIAKQLKIKKKDIILYGSSGGGAACFEIASLIPGSTCVAINAQLYLETFSYYERFKAITQQDPLHDPLKRNNIEHWIKLNNKTRYILVENVLSENDRDNIMRLSQSLNFPIRYGISKEKNIIVWCYAAEADDPHNAQEDCYVHFQIMHLRNLFDKPGEFESYKSLYTLFSEMWYYKWKDLRISNEQNESIIDLNSNKTESVYEKQQFILAATDSSYNAIILSDQLEKSTHYRIRVQGAKISGAEKYAIAIKDPIRNELIWKQQVEEGDVTVEFMTGSVVKGLELKIYAGLPGKTINVELSVEKLSIEKYV